MHRFKRYIQKHVNWYNQHFRRVKNEKLSGTSYSDLCDIAAENFKVAQGKAFLFLDCVPILQQLPKFDPMCKEIDEIVIDDDDVAGGADDAVQEDEKKAVAVNLIGAPMGSGKPRPLGSKAAKRMIKEENSICSMESSKTLAMEKLAEVQVALMETLKERMAKEHQKEERERQKEERERLAHEKDTLFRACEVYSRLGMMDKVAELMKKIDAMTQTPIAAVVPIKLVETSTMSIASGEPSPLSGTGTSPLSGTGTDAAGLFDDSDAQGI